MSEQKESEVKIRSGMSFRMEQMKWAMSEEEKK